MRFPLSWLKEYVDVELPPQQIAKILTLAGLEVDSFESEPLGFTKVVVAEVLEASPHPNADKLRIAKVTDGTEEFQVVCGAPNCRAGMKTALATIGAEIKTDGEVFKIKKSKIRGIESFGMLCSPKELGISSESEGIIEFAEHLTVGRDVADLYADTLFEISLTPNLNHASSILGIARELSAATGIPLKSPKVVLQEDQKPASTVAKVEILDKSNCPYYAGRVLEGITPTESPEWMRKRLIACGLRPSFPAVDVTNYVLLEMGQPLHAFDLDTIADGKIIVRSSHKNEKIKTLDGKERALTEEMLVIADKNKALAIAGVMGGEDSEVKEATSRVFIESAYFFPGSIRRTSKSLGLTTDASKRFERQADPNGVKIALDRAALLLAEITGARILQGNIEVQEEKFPEKQILCRLAKVNGLLGIHLSLSELEEYFKRLNFKTEVKENETLLVTVPTYRGDINQEVDLIEEAARMTGYENIPRRPPLSHASEVPDAPLYTFEKEVRERLIREGLQEFLTCDLIGPAMLEGVPDPKMSERGAICVINPTSIEQSVLRTSLLQGLLHAVKFNWDREIRNVAAYEVGKIHFKIDGKYQEPLVAGIVLSGKSSPYHMDPKPRDVDFFDMKGIIENLLDGLNIKRYSFRSSDIETFHSGRQALIQVDGVNVGSLGEIHPAIQRKLDIPVRIYFAEINLGDLLNAKRADLKMRPLAIYPGSLRDWTVTVDENMPVAQILHSIQHIPSQLLEEVSHVDVFQSEKIGKGVKNVTLHFVYRDPKKTVAQEEVDKEHAHIIQIASKMVGIVQNSG